MHTFRYTPATCSCTPHGFAGFSFQYLLTRLSTSPLTPARPSTPQHAPAHPCTPRHVHSTAHVCSTVARPGAGTVPPRLRSALRLVGGGGSAHVLTRWSVGDRCRSAVVAVALVPVMMRRGRQRPMPGHAADLGRGALANGDRSWFYSRDIYICFIQNWHKL